MTIIALDSSGLVASVALWQDGSILAEYSTNFKKTHSETLLPMLEEIRNNLSLDLACVDGIAVSNGPGSFTGLRIGSATAKGLGLALDIPIIEVPTLAGLAYNLWGTDKTICPIMDARRQQVYTALYDFRPDAGKGLKLHTITEPCAIPVTELAAQINERGWEVIFLGDGVPVYEGMLAELLKVPYRFAPSHQNRQRAASIAELGAQMMEMGQTVTADEHSPIYLRKSQAENEGPQRFEI